MGDEQAARRGRAARGRASSARAIERNARVARAATSAARRPTSAPSPRAKKAPTIAWGASVGAVSVANRSSDESGSARTNASSSRSSTRAARTCTTDHRARARAAIAGVARRPRVMSRASSPLGPRSTAPNTSNASHSPASFAMTERATIEASVKRARSAGEGTAE
ncbi:MAG: hypothetical protein U0269_09105 [Polyangiales bacterium]